MAGDEPLGHVVDDVEPGPAEAAQAGEDLVDERAEGSGEMAAGIALEPPPLPLLPGAIRAVAGEPDDPEPLAAGGQGGGAGLAAVAGAVIEDQKASRPVAARRASSAWRYSSKQAESWAAQTTSTRPPPKTSTLPKVVTRRLVPAPGNVGDVIAEVVRSFDPLARQARVTLVTAVEPALPAACADRERLVQLLGNLVRNALRFTLEGGLVSLRAERDDGAVRVTVEDTGVGIPPERLPDLFERFYRGDEARDRASGGAGLGLAIVKELVEAMGGRVGVESTLGEGSRFWFTPPLAAAT